MKGRAGIAVAAVLMQTFIALLSTGCGVGGPSGGHADMEGFISGVWSISTDLGPGGVTTPC